MNAIELFFHGHQTHKDVLIAANLGSYAYLRLPPDHPDRVVFKSSFVQSSLRHGLVRSHLRKLLEIWNRHQIDAMVFKGFHLAEFVYDNPAARWCGDVDILVNEAQAEEASRLAVEHGWFESFNRNDMAFSLTDYHEQSHLYSPDRIARLDVHVRLLQSVSPDPRHKHFTKGVWCNSMVVDWQGLKLRVPSGIDALILMMINRRWGDRWRCKPQDMADAILLIEKFDLSEDDVFVRSRALNCEKTLKVVFRYFNPFKLKIAGGSPTAMQRWRNDILCWRDFGSVEWNRLSTFFRISPHLFYWTVVAFPVVVRVRKLMRTTTDLQTLVAGCESEPMVKPDQTRAYVEGVTQGVRWCLRMFGMRENACVPRSLALFSLLTRQGHAVCFASGVRSGKLALEGHAWVEVDGWPLECSGDMQSTQRFKKNFSYANALERQRGVTKNQPRQGHALGD